MNKKKHGDDESTFINEDDPYTIKHRKRTSKKQLEVLEKTFEMSIRPDAKLRKKLGEQLGMTPRAVQIWFQNRRAKVKKITGKLPKKKSKEGDKEDFNNDNNFIGDNGIVEVFDTNGMYSKYQQSYNGQYPNGYPSEQSYGEQYPISEYPISEQSYGEYPSNEYPNNKQIYPINNDQYYNEDYNYLIKNRSYPNENRPPLYYEDVPPYPPTYPSSDFVYSPEYYHKEYYHKNNDEYYHKNNDEYYHKHHDEYYHNVYLDENKEGSNVGYPPQYVDMKYYKDYFYKHNYPEPEDKEKK